MFELSHTKSSAVGCVEFMSAKRVLAAVLAILGPAIPWRLCYISIGHHSLITKYIRLYTALVLHFKYWYGIYCIISSEPEHTSG